MFRHYYHDLRTIGSLFTIPPSGETLCATQQDEDFTLIKPYLASPYCGQLCNYFHTDNAVVYWDNISNTPIMIKYAGFKIDHIRNWDGIIALLCFSDNNIRIINSETKKICTLEKLHPNGPWHGIEHANTQTYKYNGQWIIRHTNKGLSQFWHIDGTLFETQNHPEDVFTVDHLRIEDGIDCIKVWNTSTKTSCEIKHLNIDNVQHCILNDIFVASHMPISGDRCIQIRDAETGNILHQIPCLSEFYDVFSSKTIMTMPNQNVLIWDSKTRTSTKIHAPSKTSIIYVFKHPFHHQKHFVCKHHLDIGNTLVIANLIDKKIITLKEKDTIKKIGSFKNSIYVITTKGLYLRDVKGQLLCAAKEFPNHEQWCTYHAHRACGFLIFCAWSRTKDVFLFYDDKTGELLHQFQFYGSCHLCSIKRDVIIIKEYKFNKCRVLDMTMF